ncbi:mucin-5AC [Hyalella azteca]|uniref:Mucin-5AC n=1 Tax=Hyalella azteca TaxID=294128 RepID=A0A8B7PKY7_HYAAZ|nr:mucin-5AC [Hyalella azteca]
MEITATPAEEAAAIRSAKQLHVYKPGIIFVPGAKLQVQETIDNNWYDCKVVEVDWGELDILVHYLRWSDRFDEWLKMDSKRIRAVPATSVDECPFSVGEMVLALWSVDQRYYPATVMRVINPQQCEVKFRDDNISKILRCSQINKITGRMPPILPPPSAAPAAVAAAAAATSHETPTSAAPTSAPAASTPGTSKKSIFDVDICEEKRKPKRKAEFVEMFDSIRKRRSIQGPLATRSTRLLSETTPSPFVYHESSPSTTSTKTSTTRVTPSSTTSTPLTPTSAPVPRNSSASESTKTIASNATVDEVPGTVVIGDSDATSPVNATKEYPSPHSGLSNFGPSQLMCENPPQSLLPKVTRHRVLDDIDLTSSPDKISNVSPSILDPSNLVKGHKIANTTPKVSSTSSHAHPSVPATLKSKIPDQPDLQKKKIQAVEFETPNQEFSKQQTSLQPPSTTNTNSELAQSLLTPPVKMSVKKAKPSKTSVTPKPSLLANLSTTRRAPVADDCMLSWEKHGCNVVKENSFPGWRKQYSRRLPYTGLDSWDVAYFAPDGSVIRNKRDLSAYAENNTLPCLVASFDFTAAGVKDAMLEHMKVCSVGTAKVGVSRTIALPSTLVSPAPVNPVPLTPSMKTRSSGASHKKTGDSPAQNTAETPTQMRGFLWPKISSSVQPISVTNPPSSEQLDLSVKETTRSSEQVLRPKKKTPVLANDEISNEKSKRRTDVSPVTRPSSLTLAESSQDSASSSTSSAANSAAVVPSSAAVIPSSAAVIPSSAAVIPSSAAVIPSSAAVIPSSAAVVPSSAAVIPSSAAVVPSSTAAVSSSSLILDDEEHEMGVCSSDSDDDELDVLSPQSQPNKTIHGRIDSKSNTSSHNLASRASLPCRIKIEIPIAVGREVRGENSPLLESPVKRSPLVEAPASPLKARPAPPLRETNSPGVSVGEHVCVVKNCNKIFRNDNLLQMHIKHYHPESSYRLGSSAPNVADLAYARTVEGLLEADKRGAGDRRRKRHSLGAVPEGKRRRLEPSKDYNRRKSTAVVNVMDDSDSVDTDSVDLRRPDPAHNSDWTADQDSTTGDAASTANDNILLQTDSDEESDFVGFPSVPTGKKRSVLVSNKLQNMDTETVASADDDTSEAEATDDAHEDDKDDDEFGHRHIINCCCGSSEEDGLMLQCDVCMCWQHAQCYSIGKEAVPEKYVCSMCTNPVRVRSSHRFDHQIRNWLKDGTIPKFSFSSDDDGRSKRLEMAIQRGHELSACLLQQRRVLHALNVTLAIAKKPDHPKLVMWHKKWADPRPPGSIPSILPLLPSTFPLIPVTAFQSYLPQIPGTLFSHSTLPSSTSLTQDDAALIRDIIDMEPLMPADKILMQTNTVFEEVSSLMPNSSCIMDPAPLLNPSHQVSVPSHFEDMSLSLTSVPSAPVAASPFVSSEDVTVNNMTNFMQPQVQQLAVSLQSSLIVDSPFEGQDNMGPSGNENFLAPVFASSVTSSMLDTVSLVSSPLDLPSHLSNILQCTVASSGPYNVSTGITADLSMLPSSCTSSMSALQFQVSQCLPSVHSLVPLPFSNGTSMDTMAHVASSNNLANNSILKDLGATIDINSLPMVSEAIGPAITSNHSLSLSTQQVSSLATPITAATIVSVSSSILGVSTHTIATLPVTGLESNSLASMSDEVGAAAMSVPPESCPSLDATNETRADNSEKTAHCLREAENSEDSGTNNDHIENLILKSSKIFVGESKDGDEFASHVYDTEHGDDSCVQQNSHFRREDIDNTTIAHGSIETKATKEITVSGQHSDFSSAHLGSNANQDLNSGSETTGECSVDNKNDSNFDLQLSISTSEKSKESSLLVGNLNKDKPDVLPTEKNYNLDVLFPGDQTGTSISTQTPTNRDGAVSDQVMDFAQTTTTSILPDELTTNNENTSSSGEVGFAVPSESSMYKIEVVSVRNSISGHVQLQTSESQGSNTAATSFGDGVQESRLIESPTSVPETTTSTLDVPTSVPDASIFVSDAPTSAPEVSTSAPEANTFAPEAIISVPEATIFVPEANTSAPEATVSISEVNTSVPEASTSVLAANTSMLEANTSVLETTTSMPEASTSVPKATTFVSEATTSLSEATTSVSEATTSVSEATTSVSEATTSVSESTTSVSEATTSVSDHFRVGSNHFRVGSNHFRVGSNYFRVGSNYFRVGINHFRVGSNHFRVGGTHFRVGSNHFRVGSNHCRAGGNYFHAGSCHFPHGCSNVSFPEAERIEPVKCKLNLLSHVQAVQDTLERAYDAIEAEISKLEEEMGITDDLENDPATDASSRQLMQMVLADINVLERLALHSN